VARAKSSIGTCRFIVWHEPSPGEGNQGKKYPEIAKRKFGYFVTEEEKYKEISNYLHLNNRRSPVIYDVWMRMERCQEKYPKYKKMEITKVKSEIQELMKEVISKQPYLFDISHLLN
jgi:hypothetical protein